MLTPPLDASTEKALREKCGVFGVLAPKTIEMGHLLYFGLYALQHRGQESCGMAVFDNDQLNLHKNVGLVSQVFSQELLATMTGQVGVGHTRYATTGGSCRENSQPVVCRSRLGSLVLAHNGNLFNLPEFRESCGLEYSDAFGADSDSHLMARAVAQALVRTKGDLLKATQAVLSQCEGAFSVVIATGDTLVAARDRYGIRPLCLGKTEQGYWVVASESCALDIVGAQFIRTIQPGEVWMVNRDGETTSLFLEGSTESKLCVFEYVYFARPDSNLESKSVYAARLAMGKILAQKAPVPADVVIPVPDSGNMAAVGYSQASGIPYAEGLIKNRYVGRTFIHPTQELRELGIRLKLNPLREVLENKRVVVVDDSIVRGTTSRRLVQLLRESGVREIHFRVSSAPVKHPCFYGIDMSTEAELLANQMSLEETRDWIGADSLAYLTQSEMAEAVQRSESTLCMACFNNHYPAGRPACQESQMSLLNPMATPTL
jgi:amidophosphoribosyltransferase